MAGQCSLQSEAKVLCHCRALQPGIPRIPRGRLPPRSSSQECPAEHFGEQAEDLLIQILILVPVKLAVVSVQWSPGQEKHTMGLQRDEL